VVRGICTLRPGVLGRSERIRVVSVLGRFLEHSRIYRFANGGEPEYFIGSSDLRPRNLRRRVELLVPVIDAEHRARLDHVLELYLDDATGWELMSTGEYVRRGGQLGAQDALAAARDEAIADIS
jgi:polyphosphate kinase